MPLIGRNVQGKPVPAGRPLRVQSTYLERDPNGEERVIQVLEPEDPEAVKERNFAHTPWLHNAIKSTGKKKNARFQVK